MAKSKKQLRETDSICKVLNVIKLLHQCSIPSADDLRSYCSSWHLAFPSSEWGLLQRSWGKLSLFLSLSVDPQSDALTEVVGIVLAVTWFCQCRLRALCKCAWQIANSLVFLPELWVGIEWSCLKNRERERKGERVRDCPPKSLICPHPACLVLKHGVMAHSWI